MSRNETDCNALLQFTQLKELFCELYISCVDEFFSMRAAIGVLPIALHAVNESLTTTYSLQVRLNFRSVIGRKGVGPKIAMEESSLARVLTFIELSASVRLGVENICGI